ncbi:MAG: hypothetical protein OEZ22_03495 [Spirochaetia bacterium]|nr:hypothetical protein [Spirochaetia bacterium]
MAALLKLLKIQRKLPLIFSFYFLVFLISKNSFSQEKVPLSEDITEEANKAEASVENEKKILDYDIIQDETPSVDRENESDESARQIETIETIEAPESAEEKITQQDEINVIPIKKKYQRVIPSVITEQLNNAPENPSFLYETRYIPEIEDTSEFLSPKVEKSIIIERLAAVEKNEEEHETEDGNNEINLKIKLPSFTQILIVIGILIVFILYRIRVKKIKRGDYTRGLK